MLSSINLFLIKPARNNDKILTPAAFKIYNNLLKFSCFVIVDYFYINGRIISFVLLK